MTDVYTKKPLHYEAIPNTLENQERILSLVPVALPLPESVLVWCLDTNQVERVCDNQADFDIRYQIVVQ